VPADPLLSLCIPTYERADLLANLLTTLAREVTPALASAVEVLVSDNASGDHTRAVVESFRATIPNLRYHRHEQNLGSNQNFLSCMALATGRYVWLIGDDDQLAPGSVARLVALLGAHPAVQVVLTNVRVGELHAAPEWRGSRFAETDSDELQALAGLLHRFGCIPLLGLLSGTVMRRPPAERLAIAPDHLWRRGSLVEMFLALDLYLEAPALLLHEPLVVWDTPAARYSYESAMARGYAAEFLVWPLYWLAGLHELRCAGRVQGELHSHFYRMLFSDRCLPELALERLLFLIVHHEQSVTPALWSLLETVFSGDPLFAPLQDRLARARALYAAWCAPGADREALTSALLALTPAAPLLPAPFPGQQTAVAAAPGAPLLSLCIPTYQRAAYLPTQLESILAQAPRGGEVEIVISDNGSLDATMAVVCAYLPRFPHLRYRRQPENAGYDQNALRVVAAARGAYCWLLSDDDALTAGTIARLLAELALGYDLYTFPILICDEELRPREQYRALIAPEERMFQPADCPDTYIAASQGLGAFFSFLSLMVFRRAVWQRSRRPERFVGSAFAHAGPLIEALLAGVISIKYVPQEFVLRRDLTPTLIAEGRLAAAMMINIDGYKRLLALLFPPASNAAAVLRRRIAQEAPWYTLTQLLEAKARCRDAESRRALQRLAARACLAGGRQPRLRYLAFRLLTLGAYRRMQPLVLRSHALVGRLRRRWRRVAA